MHPLVYAFLTLRQCRRQDRIDRYLLFSALTLTAMAIGLAMAALPMTQH